MTDALDFDALLPRLRARAADPDRRTDVRPSEFKAPVSTMDLGGIMRLGRDMSRELGRVVEANQRGEVDETGFARARDFHAPMMTPAPAVLPAPASEAALSAAEARLGVRLPPALRRVYAEVADGGFGPGEGILPLAMLAQEYLHLRDGEELPRGRTWPEGLLPVVEQEPGWDCVEAATGRVVAWDPGDLGERASEARFRRSFSEQFRGVEAWLEAWVGSRTQAEQVAEMMARLMSDPSQVRAVREARDQTWRMTPAERAAMGLPATGRERVVWGGLGRDEDEGAAP